jgi:signal transduction histidine kinase
MLNLTVTNRVETQHLAHPNGALEVGRGPSRDGVPRVVIRDAFVSRDHVRLEEADGGRRVRLTNLSTKAPVAVDNNTLLSPGENGEFLLPVRLGLGETLIDVTGAEAEPVSDQMLRTVTAPVRGDTAAHPNLLAISQSAPVEQVVGWLETVIAVQKAATITELYQQTADALVDRIGLDCGLVLLREGDGWRVAAVNNRNDRTQGRNFSQTMLQRVLAEKRTFYLPASAAAGIDSMLGVQGVVASPVFDPRDAVVGVVYGTRLQRTRAREIGPLEAQVVQLLAAAVGTGLARQEREAEATRLRVAKQAAEEADRAKSGFLAMISHELRTPLTTIIGYAEMLLDQATTDNLPQYAADLRHVLGAGQHLLTLINDILDLSKIEAGKLELAKEPYDPAGLVRETLASVEPLAKKNGNRLEADCAADLGKCVGDPTRLRQCVLNLVGNACKFTSNGVVKVTARRLAEDGEDYLSVEVSDTGIGMTPDQMERLFQAFTQVDPSAGRKYGGTGLGLAISQKLCRAMGGKIVVESQHGKGSTFTMTVKANPG